METLTKDELIALITLLANAQVKVSDANSAIILLAKLQRMIEPQPEPERERTTALS